MTETSRTMERIRCHRQADAEFGSEADERRIDIEMISLTDETVTLAKRIAGAQRVTVDAAVRFALEELAKSRHIDIGATRPERHRMSITAHEY